MMSIISCLLLSITLTTPTKVNICVNCKHYIKVVRFAGITGDPSFSKCALFPKDNLEEKVEYVVTGKKVKPILKKYSYCSTARSFENMCGIEGRLYEPQKA